MEKQITTKQRGDAGEMLVAAELSLAGVPAMKAPDNWPGADVIAKIRKGYASVQGKTLTWSDRGDYFVEYQNYNEFEWLAVVLLKCPGGGRRLFVIPRDVADSKATRNAPETKTASARYWVLKRTPELFGEYENNFTLRSDIGQPATANPCTAA